MTDKKIADPTWILSLPAAHTTLNYFSVIHFFVIVPQIELH